MKVRVHEVAGGSEDVGSRAWKARGSVSWRAGETAVRRGHGRGGGRGGGVKRTHLAVAVAQHFAHACPCSDATAVAAPVGRPTDGRPPLTRSARRQAAPAVCGVFLQPEQPGSRLLGQPCGPAPASSHQLPCRPGSRSASGPARVRPGTGSCGTPCRRGTRARTWGPAHAVTRNAGLGPCTHGMPGTRATSSLRTCVGAG